MIYPNPNSGSFIIRSVVTMDLKIIDELGKVVKFISLSEENNFTQKISSIPLGIYFIINPINSFSKKIMVTN